MTSNVRTTEQIRAEISALTAELSVISGEPLRIWDGTLGDLADTPSGGALLHVSWAISDASYTDWYPTVEAAKAALLDLALDNGTTPDEDGWHVDLTSPGCHSSRAYIERRGPVTPTFCGRTPDFSAYLPWGECRLVKTDRPGLEILLRPHCEGDLVAPDGTPWYGVAVLSMIGARRSVPGFKEAVCPDIPIVFQPW